MYCPNCGFLNEDDAPSCSKCYINLSSTSLKDIEKSPYVGFWKRFRAHLADWLAVSLLLFVIEICVGALGIFIPQLLSDLIISLLSLIAIVLYFAGFDSSTYQGTIGKQGVGIKITDLEGNCWELDIFLYYSPKRNKGFMTWWLEQ
ncbi:MAG: hypothetical protein PWQ50_2115 [Methanolobus sp.]|nr:hypothetical protein [Methanolobus sp.]